MDSCITAIQFKEIYGFKSICAAFRCLDYFVLHSCKCLSVTNLFHMLLKHPLSKVTQNLRQQQHAIQGYWRQWSGHSCRTKLFAWWESENQKWRRTKVDPQRKIKAVEKEERISARRTEDKRGWGVMVKLWLLQRKLLFAEIWGRLSRD